MSDDRRIALGLGEEVAIRRATKAEQTSLGLRTQDLVVEYCHTDREPDVLPALGLVIEPRRYGVTLPDGGPQEEM